MTRIVVALGGNALIRRGEEGSTEVQRRNLVEAARALVQLETDGHELVLTHGNGPQVGYLAIEADAARDTVPPPPLDVLVAESQGQIGYLLAQALGAAFAEQGRDRTVIALLTRVVVDPADPAFDRPSKPIGPIYPDEATATRCVEPGSTIARDGRGWRRVVASPAPRQIVEAEAIRRLADTGCLVIASGGGGIPVQRVAGRGLTGVEAVVDKDLAAVVLAEAVGAEALLLLTDVRAVQRHWGTPDTTPIRHLSLAEAKAGIADGTFAAGSMGPKVAAAAAFAARTGGVAAIGAIDEAVNVLRGEAGTRIGDTPIRSLSAPRRSRRPSPR